MSERRVATPQGEARLVTRRAKAPLARLLLTHGAGGGIDAPDLVAIRDALPAHGVGVTLVEMPWRVQGRKLAPRPALIDEAFRAIARATRSRTPLVIGGRSAGARSACRIGVEVGAAGVVALAFPLHPPGKPESSRLGELAGAGLPALVIQGERDPFGRPEEFPGDVDLTVVPAADHALRVPATAPITQAEASAIIVEALIEWLVREVVGARPG